MTEYTDLMKKYVDTLVRAAEKAKLPDMEEAANHHEQNIQGWQQQMDDDEDINEQFPQELEK